jgi:hypothetical protein
MVIISTRATEVIIQAESPELTAHGVVTPAAQTVGAGAAAGAAAGSAAAAGAAAAGAAGA